jgi:hypothetical protein
MTESLTAEFSGFFKFYPTTTPRIYGPDNVNTDAVYHDLAFIASDEAAIHSCCAISALHQCYVQERRRDNRERDRIMQVKREGFKHVFEAVKLLSLRFANIKEALSNSTIATVTRLVVVVVRAPVLFVR